MPEPDSFLPWRVHCNAAMWNFITLGKSHACTGIGGPSKQQRVVLRHRNTVVRGKCVLPSALLVIIVIIGRFGDDFTCQMT